MAESNRRSVTIHPDPPPPPRPLGDRLIKLVLFPGLLLILCLLLFFYQFYPTFHLISVSTTPNSTADSATWHLSLKVSNPNFIWSIKYSTFHVSLFYVDKDNYYNVDSQILAETKLGPLVQKRKALDMLYVNMNVSNANVGNIVVKKILDDQRKLGFVRFRIRVSFLVKIKEYGVVEEWEPNRIFCDDLNIVFNTSGQGFVSDLPKRVRFDFRFMVLLL